MYTTIRRYTLPNRNAVEEVARRATEGFAPLLREAPGFVSWSLVYAGGDALLAISTFEEQRAASASTRQAAAWVREHLADLLPDPPEVLVGEVLAHQAK